MQNKHTIIIFTEERKRLSAQAIKDYFLDDKDILTIIIGEDEFMGIATLIAKDRLFREDGSVIKSVNKIKTSLDEKNIDKLPHLKLEYKSNVLSHKKMLNILNRYHPDLIILNGKGVLEEALSAREKACPDTQIAMVMDDYFLNKQLLCEKIDRFFVASSDIKAAMVDAHIDEKTISIVDLPCSPKHLIKRPSAENSARFLLDASKKTVLFLAVANDSTGIKYAVEEALPCKDDYNFIVYAGTDRALYSYCRENAVVAVNEGVSLETLFSLSDILITRPVASYISVAIQRGMPMCELKPCTETEKRNARATAEMLIDTTKSTTLVAYLSQGVTDEAFQDQREAQAEYKAAHPYGMLKHYITSIIKKA